MCPHCGSVNLFPGFSKMLAFTCLQCGKAICVRSSESSPPCSRGARPREDRNGDKPAK
jgi:uncharacterized protein (DUF983 family)